MSLPTTLAKPYTMVSGTDALAADVNGDFDYTISALNATNTQVNTNTTDIAAKVPKSDIDTDGALAANSDVKVASQKATKTYADTKIAASYLDTDGTLAANSDTKIATQKAVKTFVAATAFNAALPDQSGHAGEFVTTDGTDASWAAISIPTGSTLTMYQTLGGL